MRELSHLWFSSSSSSKGEGVGGRSADVSRMSYPHILFEVSPWYTNRQSALLQPMTSARNAKFYVLIRL